MILVWGFMVIFMLNCLYLINGKILNMIIFFIVNLDVKNLVLVVNVRIDKDY